MKGRDFAMRTMPLVFTLGGLTILVIATLLGGLPIAPSHPGPVPSMATPVVRRSDVIIERIQALSRLETASYTVQTVIEVQQRQGDPLTDWLAGDTLLLIARGSVIAGVDLGELDAEDVSLAPDGQTITVHLPPARIVRAALDTAGTRVYSRQRGWFAPPNLDLETLARQEAEAQILHLACDDGILIRAADQAAATMQRILSLVDAGGPVLVRPGPPTACPTSMPPER